MHVATDTLNLQNAHGIQICCIFFFEFLFSLCSEPEQAVSVLGELQKISRPVSISLNEMLTLMDKCQQLERINMRPTHSATDDTGKPEPPKNQLFNNPFSLFSGIIPGTR